MIATLGALRFVFIMLVVFSHMIGDAFDFGGECGVAFFFMLSGFVLSAGRRPAERSPLRLAVRQLSKFYPLHVAMLLVFAALDVAMRGGAEWRALLPNLLLLHSWIPDRAVFFSFNGVSWFLCDIMFCYLLYSRLSAAVWRMAWGRLALCGAALAAVYAALACAVRPEQVDALLYVQPVLRTVDFAAGIALWRYYAVSGARRSAAFARLGILWQTAVELAVVALFVAAYAAYPHLPPACRCAALFWLPSAVCIYVFAVADAGGGLLSRLLRRPPVQWLGSLSMGIFMTHLLAVRIARSSLSAAVGVAGSLVAECVAALLLTLAFAVVAGRCFSGRAIYDFAIKYLKK